jgi:hypothetical protein
MQDLAHYRQLVFILKWLCYLSRNRAFGIEENAELFSLPLLFYKKIYPLGDRF